MEAYCLKCKEKRDIKDPTAEFTANGSPITKGTCPVCGCKMSKMGHTEAHDLLEKPVVTASKSAGTKKTSAAKKPAAKKPAAKKTTAKRTAAKPAVSHAGIGRNQSLVIVESPTKARTIGRFLGRDYVVRASVGHVRDLLKSTLSVDVENNFEPKYRVPNEKKPLVKELTELAAGAKKVYLATDPDREGEAIAWHLVESAQIDPKKTERVVFHEITDSAVKAAFDNPGEVDMNLVDAQQSRRILDRLVGYQISPILWTKIQGHLSAGRVQSVAVKLIVDREREIDAFVPKEYWTVFADFLPEGLKETFRAKLAKISGKDIELSSKEEVDGHLARLEKAVYAIKSLKTGKRIRKPFPPFTTSTLQQEANKRLGMTSKKTMSIAQQLYEGLDVGESGPAGLITYMRTDSTNIAEAAQKDARTFILSEYGKEYAPAKYPVYSKKAKGAQEAHEAIRPTSVFRTPEKMKNFLDRDQLRLYTLIWKRFVASQMSDAVYETQTVDVETKGSPVYLFRASGSRILFKGFLTVMEDAKEDESKEENTKIPAGLFEGQPQKLKKLYPEQHFTQPPARYTEATLVKTLEEDGIGRPSTYASIISTILQRKYVAVEAKHLVPTDIGILVNDYLTEHFPDIVDVNFTSVLEEQLDEVAEGGKAWVDVIREFYGSFEPELEKARASMPKQQAKAEPEKVGRDCPQCGSPLVYRNGRFGRFIACSGFPKCRYSEAMIEKLDVKCPKCGGDMVVKHSKNGRTFYGCSNYPKCEFTQWKRPIKQACPACGGMMLQISKTHARCIDCATIISSREEGAES